MPKQNPKEAMQDLTLMLLYLSSFTEKNPYSDEKFYRAWKSYDWDTVDALDEAELIIQGNRRNKSVYLTDDGLARARQLLEQFEIADWTQD